MSSAEPVLTKARRSVWLAIEHWPPLEGVFQRVWKFEDTAALGGDPVPSIGDLPALAIFPVSTTPAWILSGTQQIPYTLEARLWTRHGSLLAGESLWQEITRAIFQSAPVNGPTHVFRGTGFGGADLGPITVSVARLGAPGPTCALWRWTIGLRVNWNPMH